jgi:hypothetical protein
MDWIQRLFSGWEIAAVGSTCHGRFLSAGTACRASLSTWRPRGVRCAIYHGCKTRPRRSRSSVRAHRRAGPKHLAAHHLCPASPGASSPRSAFHVPSRSPRCARAPFYSLVARAADRRAPTPPAPPSPSRVPRPKPLVLELQRHSAKPHPSRLDTGPSALRHRLRVHVRCRPTSPIASRCHLRASRQQPSVHLEPPVSTSPSLPTIELLPPQHPPRRHVVPRHPRATPRRAVVRNAASCMLSSPPRECLHANGPPLLESAPLHPPQAPGRPRAAPGLAIHCS